MRNNEEIQNYTITTNLFEVTVNFEHREAGLYDNLEYHKAFRVENPDCW